MEGDSESETSVSETPGNNLNVATATTLGPKRKRFHGSSAANRIDYKHVDPWLEFCK